MMRTFRTTAWKPVAFGATLMAVVVSGGGAGAALRPCWWPPVSAPVIDPYREPACRWCPGNRGLEYGTRAGMPAATERTGIPARVPYSSPRLPGHHRHAGSR